MASVELKSLTKTFNGAPTPVVDALSVEIKDKEFMVLVGPSGCGKSTTLRMIAGLEEPTSGEIIIAGRSVTRMAPKDRDIAMVFQNYALYPHLNVFNNLAFSLKLRKYAQREIAERVGQAAAILGIEGLLKRRPRELSGGQRQRVALGRALVREPKVFLFDEPLSNLDAKLRVQMRIEILKLHQQLQTTMIYVTHDQMEAMTMGDRIVVLKDGLLQQVDEPLSLYNHPVNQFVAGFIGSPAMNFLPLFADNGKPNSVGSKIFSQLKGQVQGLLARARTLGIRPERLQLSKPDCQVSFEAEAEVSEEMGHETLHYLRLQDLTLTVREMGHTTRIVPGNPVPLGFNLDDCHFFDEAGQTLTE